MKKDEMLEKAKRMINYWNFWEKGFEDYCNRKPQGYGVDVEATTEEKDAYLGGWYEAKEKRSDKCQ